MSCEVPNPSRLENRGMLWMVGAFVFCPCHLPITLSVLALMLGGTAAGIFVKTHPYLAGSLTTILWVAGTWRGFSLVRTAQRVTYNARRHGVLQPVSRHHD